MDVYFYDVVDKLSLGNATRCKTMKELLNIVDVVTLHVDGRPSNKSFFGADEFKEMKEGSYFLNLARGHVVDVPSLVENMKSGKIIGAGVDVFPEEPKTNAEPFSSELMGLPNLILTPHIGGSTSEAQIHIGNYVPGKVISYVNSGSSYGSVNFPNIQLSEQKESHRLLHVHNNKPGVLLKINEILSHSGCNVLGQYLKTSEKIGFVIIDVDKEHGNEVLNALKSVPETIKTRILY